MNQFIYNLLNDAGNHLVTDSPMSLKGKVLAAYIAKRTKQGAEPRELKEEIDELDDILQKVAIERAQYNSQRAVGAILENFSDEAWILKVLESDNSTNAQYLNDHLRKGDTYEIRDSNGST